MLTDLQRRVARVVASVPAAHGFALGGGAAMIVHRLVDRTTRDLDFFSTNADDVLAAISAIEAALAGHGFTTTRVRAVPGFAQIEVHDGASSCLVDLVAEPHLAPPVPSPIGPVLAPDDVAAGKVLALFGRARGRDFVDVFALTKRYDTARLCELAGERDLGFDRRVLGEMIGLIGRLPRAEFEVDDATLAELRAFFTEWRRELEA